jgi:hypothetical protein
MADLGWSSYIRAQENAHWGACFEAAAKQGMTPAQAEDCDDGDKGCPECPWKEELSKYDAAHRNTR